jgi:hypothetical protein
MKQIIITTTILLTLFGAYGEWCEYYGQQQILSIPITCSADHVTLSGKHYNKASINSLTCNGQVIIMDNLRVGRLVERSNNRVFGMDKR